MGGGTGCLYSAWFVRLLDPVSHIQTPPASRTGHNTPEAVGVGRSVGRPAGSPPHKAGSLQGGGSRLRRGGGDLARLCWGAAGVTSSLLYGAAAEATTSLLYGAAAGATSPLLCVLGGATSPPVCVGGERPRPLCWGGEGGGATSPTLLGGGDLNPSRLRLRFAPRSSRGAERSRNQAAVPLGSWHLNCLLFIAFGFVAFELRVTQLQCKPSQRPSPVPNGSDRFHCRRDRAGSDAGRGGRRAARCRENGLEGARDLVAALGLLRVVDDVPLEY